jgi:hypothetical protein
MLTLRQSVSYLLAGSILFSAGCGFDTPTQPDSPGIGIVDEQASGSERAFESSRHR